MPREDKIKEITERLEQGIKELFTSERYKEYLRVMSQFHRYSFNNTVLIAMQKPDASLVAGYQAWQKKFNRHVKRGEKGIQIISPAPVKEKYEVEKIDPETKEPVLRPDGQPETEEVEHIIPRFRVATVFDVSQTDGEPLPELMEGNLTASVENFEQFMEAIRAVSPAPIRFDEITSGANGYYSLTDKEIVIQSGMSESQTMKTAVHEVTHALLHDRDQMKEQGIVKDKQTIEVEAESVASTVCEFFGLDTSSYSFPYIASWSSSMEMRELRSSMDTIRRTAGDFIEQMTEQLQLLAKEQEVSQEQETDKEQEAEQTNPFSDLSGKEKELLTSTSQLYGIYQIKEDSPAEEYHFMNMDFVNRHGIEIRKEDYELVYSGEFSPSDTLDSIFVRFNINRPEDFTGHSLSVSDIVVLNEGGKVSAHYVDSIGFEELEHFLPEMEKQEQEKDSPASEKTDTLITMDSTGIEVDGHEGTWHPVEMQEFAGKSFFLMEHETFGDTVAKVVVDEKGTLFAEDLWNGFDKGAREAIGEVLVDMGLPVTPDLLSGDRLEQERIPLVIMTGRQARESGQLEAYRDSLRENVACKQAIEDAISENFDGLHLKGNIAGDILEKFGKERVMLVLATTVQVKEWDGRFSRDNKEWAKDFAAPPDPDGFGGDRRTDFVVESHPAVLDGFISQTRRRLQEMEMEEQKEPVSFVARFYVADDIHADQPRIAYFDNLSDALQEYSSLSNHLEKQIGMESSEEPPSRMPLISCKNGLETLNDIEAASLSGKWVTPETMQARKEAQEYLDYHDVEIAYQLNSGEYLFIQDYSEGGYEYTFYDKSFHELDGGVLDNPELSMEEAIDELLSEKHMTLSNCKVIEADNFRETADRAQYFPQEAYEALKPLMDNGQDEIAFQVGDSYVLIQMGSEGYQYITYDEKWNETNCKQYLGPVSSMEDAVGFVFGDEHFGNAKVTPISVTDLVKETEKHAREQLYEEPVPLRSGISRKEAALNGECRNDLEETVLSYAQAVLDDMGLSEEVKLNGARVYGSRTREGLYGENSDVDVVLSYTGSLREDAFFNELHANKMETAGMNIDINPISTEKTGTLAEYLEMAEKYLDRQEAEKLAADIDAFAYDNDYYEYQDNVEDRKDHLLEVQSDLTEGRTAPLKEWLQEFVDNAEPADVAADAKDLIKRIDEMADKFPKKEVEAEKPEPKLTFFVAECMEYPVLGEYHEKLTLQEAYEIYKSIPDERMNGGKGIGVHLDDGSEYPAEYQLMQWGAIDKDVLSYVYGDKESQMVKQAMTELENVMNADAPAKEPQDKSKDTLQEEMPKTVGAARSDNAGPVDKAKDTVAKEITKDTRLEERPGLPKSEVSTKQSVLSALRSRQEKIKNQEKEKEPVKSQTHKKGDQQL